MRIRQVYKYLIERATEQSCELRIHHVYPIKIPLQPLQYYHCRYYYLSILCFITFPSRSFHIYFMQPLKNYNHLLLALYHISKSKVLDYLLPTKSASCHSPSVCIGRSVYFSLGFHHLKFPNMPSPNHTFLPRMDTNSNVNNALLMSVMILLA